MRILSIILFTLLSISVYTQSDTDSIDVIVQYLDSDNIDGKTISPEISDWGTFNHIKVYTDKGKTITIRPKSGAKLLLFSNDFENVYIPITDKHGDRFVRVYLLGEILILKEDYRYCHGKLSTSKKNTCLWTKRRKSIFISKDGVVSKRIKRCNYKRIVKPFVCDKPTICNMINKSKYKYKSIDDLINQYNAH